MLRFICDICGTAASTVICHTDSTYLCSACDDFIHAEANPMAGHHFRVPINSTASTLLYGELNHCQAETTGDASEEFFYYGSDTGECFDDLITLTSPIVEQSPEVSTIQAASSVSGAPNCQTVPKSCMRPEIRLSFTTQSGEKAKAKTVEETTISREERVRRFREKRKAKQMRRKKNIFPSKKAYAASIRPRINGKFARRPTDKIVN